MTTRQTSAPADNNPPTPQAGGRLLVIVVTWQAADLTIQCLRSIEPELATLSDCRIIVVDNDSKDGSDLRIRQAIDDNGWTDWVTFLRAPENVGFAAGNNIAIREQLQDEHPADYVLLLNPDTIVRPGAFRTLVDFMDQHPDVGIAGGRSVDPDDTPQLCCFRFPGMLSEFTLYLQLGIADRLLGRYLTRVPFSEQAHPIGWVSGAFMIIRNQVFRDIGLMDEGYFLYYEETDFTLRARRAGWTCWHVPQGRVVHFVGHSTGVTIRGERPGRRPRFWFESRHRYFLKNYGLIYTVFTDFLAITAFAFWRLRRFIQRKPDMDPPKFFGDLVRHSVFARGRRLNTSEEARPVFRD